ncbi:MAG: STAS domain-containing protein [Deltaproteobacteria bacterium]|nr:MAG: STAS domain-containing protein [Deltaproteobacteria bacterium]TMQ12798.1 MAG: STAS domain-containing protein [Deltaproteobacteria bacterium]
MEAVEDEASAAVQLLWKGKSNHRHPGEALAPYFREVLAIAAQKRVPLELHFEKLDHFNSSTISSIIQLIQDSRARSVKLVLVYDQALKWQKLSFDALRVFARDDLLELRSA